jgi:ATP-binding cassette subfamily C (CFTR/MRP) protein 1
MIPTSTGTLTIDALPVASLRPHVLRSALITIPQEAPSLPGTIRFNADPSTSLSTASIRAALSAVGLHDLVTARGGLDATMSSLRLSSGQAQLFALARAMLMVERRQEQFGDSKTVLLLDEVTANVDTDTEGKMMEVLNGELFRGMTVFAVAHRLQTVVEMDRVVVLEKGCIIECGVPAELMETEGSVFRAMFGSVG